MANPILSTPAYLSSPPVQEACSLVADLCRLFYPQGWVTGTGGSITVKVHDDSVPKSQQLIVMSPSGVQKERMEPQDMYVMSGDGNMLIEPSPKPYPHKAPKCTDCGPLFMKAYTMRDAGTVIHSHGMESCIVTMMNPSAKEFKMTHMEMIKGIKGHGYRDELVVPIIENQPQESELTDSFAEAIEAYPKATAVLVRNHGIFVWGDTWISAKTQAECYHYLFDAAIRLYQLGIDWTTPDHGPLNIPRAIQQTPATGGLQHDNYAVESSRKFIVLDIEGTTTPISFVTDVLFPYARDNVRKHLISTFDNKETKEDIELLRVQVEEDCKNGVAGAVPIPPENSGRDSVIDAIVTNVEAMIKADRKITSLKQLQGHIWRTGYECKDLLGIVFEDVPEALKKWHSEGKKMACQKTDLQVRIITLYKKVEEKIRLGIFNGDPTGTHLVYIYSSGSREAQRLIFGNTSYGDLRRYLCGFFDTTVGNKKETRSYLEIAQSLGVDNESEILFVTDVYQEAVAAKTAGFEVLISIRPGNSPLPSNHGFKTITSFIEI